MRDFPGKILRLALVLGAGYLLVRVGFHFYVQDQLDQLINRAAIHANVEYEQLETDINGKIDVLRTRVVPIGQEEAIEIERISVQGPNVWDLVRSRLPVLGKGGPPAYAHLQMRKISIPLQGSLADRLDSDIQGDGLGKSDICGVNGLTSLGMARSIGMQTLYANLEAGYRYDIDRQTLDGEFSLVIPGIQSAELDVSLVNVAPETLAGTQSQIPSIASLVFTLGIKPEYGSKVALRCAGRHKISVADYKLLLADQFVRQQASLGIDLGWGLRSAVKRFYRDWGEIELSFKPDVPVNPMGLVMQDQKKLLDRLGFGVAINGERVVDLRMTIGKGKGRFSRLLFPEKEKDKTREKRLLYRSVYREISKDRLAKHIYHSTRMQLRSGQMRNGVLVSIEDNIAQLEQRRSGGWFTSYVPLTEVTRIEVLFREQLSPLSTREKTEGKQAQPGGSKQTGSYQG